MGTTFVIREGESTELTHYGILGQKWGIRRFQNPDGSLTEAGKKRYGTVENFEAAKKKVESKKQLKYEKKLLKKKPRDLTDDELAIVKRRLDAENEYKKVRDKGPSKAIKDVIGNILKSSFTDIGGQTASFVLGSAVNKWLGPMLNGLDNNKVKALQSELSGMDDEQISARLKRLENEENIAKKTGNYNTPVTNPSKSHKPK